jgi:polar amino acid transport system substrate-binding protein
MSLALPGLLFLAMVSAVGASPPPSAVPPQTHNLRLRVAINPVAPFVIKQGSTLSGFSIDLWEALARRLNWDFSWVEFRPGSSSEQLKAVVQHDVDVAISAITMTPEREAMVDFSIPYFDSGLQIMVRTQNDNPFLATVWSVFSPIIRQFSAAAIALVFFLANMLWLVERRRNPSFQKGYIPGVLEGMWGVLLIIATGEHGDRDTPDIVKRLTVGSVWLLGVVLIAQFTATVTSSLTVQQLRSSIQGPADLPGKRIATVPGTTAAAYLSSRGMSFVDVSSGDEGCNMLLQGRVQAVVFDAATLQYWAARRGQGILQVVGPIFRPEKYGIAVGQGSPLRKQINEALLRMYEDGEYEEIYNKWFSQTR